MGWLESFVTESNKIEGILRKPLGHEIRATEEFLDLPGIQIPHLKNFVSAVAPGHLLRDRVGLDVRVGSHIAPAGGMFLPAQLQRILDCVDSCTPFSVHKEYEYLHPFTDGNGRSGRALWLWHMKKTGQLSIVMHLGFLHTWYYQSLEANQNNQEE